VVLDHSGDSLLIDPSLRAGGFQVSEDSRQMPAADGLTRLDALAVRTEVRQFLAQRSSVDAEFGAQAADGP
jgi:hypothetical protein